MSFARLCFFYILISLAESSPLIASFVLKFALPYKLSRDLMCRHRKQTRIRLVGFILNVFHLRQFLHQSVNLVDSFLGFASLCTFS